MKLADWQRAFLDALVDTGPPPRSLRDDTGRRFDVYRRNVRTGLHDALAATYPVVARLVGESWFAEAALRYGRAHPSASGDLHRFGDRFAAFLATYVPANELPYLPDVARLEWACHESLHAADAPPFDFAALAALAEERREGLRLELHPAVRRVSSPFPILAIVEANHPTRDGTPDRIEGPDRVVVARAGAVRCRRVSIREWEALAAVANGATLGELVLGEGDVPGLLGEWVREGIVSGFTLAAREAS